MRLDEAKATYGKVLALDNRHVRALHYYGLVLHQQNCSDLAVNYIQQSIELKPSAGAFVNLGLAYEALGDTTRAAECYRDAIALKPTMAEASYNLGNVLSKTGEKLKALSCYDDAIRYKPDYYKAIVSRASLLAVIGQYDEAISDLSRLANTLPNLKEAPIALAQAYQYAGRYDEAIAHCEQLLALYPNDAECRWCYSLLLLLMGRWQEGWENYEWRWRTGRRTFQLNNVSGEKLSSLEHHPDKTLLVRCEQGLGDSIQFIRYVKLLPDYFKEVVVVVPAVLISLFKSVSTRVTFTESHQQLHPTDFYVPLLSLPLLFKTFHPKDVPFGDGYLTSVFSEKNPFWASVIDKNKKRIGLVWSGNQQHHNDLNRSLSLSTLTKALPCEHDYFCLQKEIREDDKDELAKGALTIHTFCEELKDFNDTAMLSSLMDIVITVDTSVAHLCGALGIPTCLLIADPPDWRWLLDCSKTPWYNSMKVFRRPIGQSWEAPLQQMRQHLLTNF
jgi:tetratricopeptide (TPR) repeat protein